ncbi:MAG TPA: ROK family glucokinase [Candidatus Fimimorpha faecalis]|uniref:Glucokinase n=1 Tax=Candidatus Fimimorpha faecalis TaxID=2840824 RepID=A0A9D1JEU1_9FIRM|nr:ROK family glucokinase [Candidatus Fimimorpha faecalis]
MKKYCIGVDVGGTSVKLGLFYHNGTVLKKWEIPTRKDKKGSNIIPDIAASIRSELVNEQIPLSDISGAGMGVPGPTMSNGYVSKCVNLGWVDCNPAEELSELLGIPVKAGNDANVAALGEAWKGGAEGFQDVVMVTLGTGVGGGVIMNGKIVAGNRGLGGELGHITVNRDESEKCNCGNKGCLEQYASATGVVKIAKRLLAERYSDSMIRNVEHLSAKKIFDAAKKKDGIAVEAVETLANYLGMAMATVTLTIDPDVFVIGGGVSNAGEILVNTIEHYYKKYLSISEKRAKIVLASLGNDAGIYGAARMVLDQDVVEEE